MKRNYLKVKCESLVRLTMSYCFSSLLSLYIVTEYPKSGGSWFSQMLADYLEVPFPRNKFPEFRTSVMQGHYLYFPTMKNVFVVHRDGRDIMVSSYYHSLFENEKFNTRLVYNTRKQVPFNDYENIRRNLPEFIKYKFTNNPTPGFTWREFVNNWDCRNKAVAVKYEDLLRDTGGTLTQALKTATKDQIDHSRIKKTVEKYSFQNLAKRQPGIEKKNSFLRKGIAGDWKNYFSQQAKEIFAEYAGDTLIKLGYEADKKWVREK